MTVKTQPDAKMEEITPVFVSLFSAYKKVRFIIISIEN